MQSSAEFLSVDIIIRDDLQSSLVTFGNIKVDYYLAINQDEDHVLGRVKPDVIHILRHEITRGLSNHIVRE